MEPLVVVGGIFVLALALAFLEIRFTPPELQRPAVVTARHQHALVFNSPMLDRPDGFVVRAELAPGQAVRVIQSRHFAFGGDTHLWVEVELAESSMRGWLREEVLAPDTPLEDLEDMVVETLPEGVTLS